MLRLSQALGNVTVVQKGEQDVISDGTQGEWAAGPGTSSRRTPGHTGATQRGMSRSACQPQQAMWECVTPASVLEK